VEQRREAMFYAARAPSTIIWSPRRAGRRRMLVVVRILFCLRGDRVRPSLTRSTRSIKIHCRRGLLRLQRCPTRSKRRRARRSPKRHCFVVVLNYSSRFALALKASYPKKRSTEQVTAAYNEEITRVKNTPIFVDIRMKHQKMLQERIAALPEVERDVARQQLTAEAP
jgi:hypothetical protein